MFLLEVFAYDFMKQALLVGVFTAISTAMLGNFVVSARQSVVSDMLAHTALVGVGLGIFWQVSPTLLALLTTVLSGVLLWWLSRQKYQAPEALSMLLLTGGLAIALLLAHLNKDNPVALDTYLFGSILTVTPHEVSLFVILNIVIIGTLLVFWRPFLTHVFDRDFLPPTLLKSATEILFMLLIALVVGISLKVVGGLLIGALLVIPVLIAQTFSQSFKHNVVGSVLANLISILVGIISSFYFDIPVSSSIVLSLILLYVLAKLSVSLKKH